MGHADGKSGDGPRLMVHLWMLLQDPSRQGLQLKGMKCMNA